MEKTTVRGVLKLLDENKEEIMKSLKQDLHKVQKPLVNLMDKALIQKQPYGVVLIIGTWNFPIMLTLMPMFGALAAGNCVLLKTSRISWSTSKLLEHIVPKYLDNDCVKVVNGGTGETTDLLKERYDYIFYTGNTSIGKMVMTAASQYLTPVTLELGGKIYVDKNCDLRAVANRILWGKTINAGQTCIAPDYVMCTKDIQEKLIEAMKITINDFYQDDPSSSDSYGRLGNERHFQRVKQIIDSSKDNIAIGGITNEKDNYVSPTVLKDVKFTDPAMLEEMFGPVLPIIPVNNEDEAIKHIVNGEKPLAMYIFSNDKKVKDKFRNSTSSGGLVINDTMLHAGVMTLPFGGVGNSGVGAYHGKLTFDTFCHNRACLERELILEGLQSIRYPPYTQKKIQIIQRVTQKKLNHSPFKSPFSVLVIGMIVAAFLLQMFALYIE
ncbi:ALDH [Mytilus edulis]|uniref:Aldehyde dehydrogenase n=1 Tax=Mytilus edulis TaxID=6550 RepID=A0A8S3RYK1_MYTED|nr:ALDH [Mytilus edulis]